MKLIKAGAKAGTFSLGGIRLASMLEKSEEELEKLEKALKTSRSFKLLKAAGVIRSSGFKGIKFAVKVFDDCRLKAGPGADFSQFLDGKSELMAQMSDMGPENFEKYFLKGGASDLEISGKCGLTFEETKKIHGFVNDFFIYSDLSVSSAATSAAPVKVYSAVAGVEIRKGRPELSFFRREIWKERFSVNKAKLNEYLKIIPKGEKGEARKTLESLGLMANRKSTLYALLEYLLEEQNEYFLKGSPETRKPLKQKTAARKLGVHPGVLNRVISNKSVQLPWGVEVPLAELLPSEKDINRERLRALINDYPGLPDRELAEKMAQIYGVKLSRRSMAQYRAEISAKKRKMIK